MLNQAFIVSSKTKRLGNYKYLMALSGSKCSLVYKKAPITCLYSIAAIDSQNKRSATNYQTLLFILFSSFSV